MLKRSKYSIIYLLFIVFFILLFVGGPDYYSLRSLRAVWDLGHIVLFTLGTYILLKKSDKLQRLSFWRQILLILLISTVIGLIIEMLQSGIERTPDLADIARDLIGSLCAVVFFSPKRKHLSKPVLQTMLILIVILLLSTLFPLTRTVADELLAKNQFPLLSDFETILESERWEATAYLERSSEKAYHGRYSLKCLINPQRYSGVALKYFPSDWAGYNALNFHIYSTASWPFDLHCRIHDKQHIENEQPYSDRFNTILKIKPGWNYIRIYLDQIKRTPQERQMDLSQVRSLAFFVIDIPKSIHIFIDYVYLN